MEDGNGKAAAQNQMDWICPPQVSVPNETKPPFCLECLSQDMLYVHFLVQYLSYSVHVSIMDGALVFR